MALLAALWLPSCGSKEVAPPGPVDIPVPSLVILISIDTLRADHLGIYGYERETSPNIDAFAAEGVVFRQAFAQASSTLASHGAMLASLLPEHHGGFFSRGQAVSPSVLTLPELLEQRGFTTAAMTGGGQLAPVYGLDQGFPHYEIVTGRFRRTVKRAANWLRNQGQDQGFLFLHTYEVHHPYDPRAQALALFDGDYDGPLPDDISSDLLTSISNGETPIDSRDLAHIEATYDGEIRSMDFAFGRLLDRLRELGLYDDALIVLTSDHGEEFGEHGQVGMHSHTLFDELLHVPLIVRFPRARFAGLDVTSQVRSLDIAPTVLDVLDIQSPDSFSGESLLELLRSPESPDRSAPGQLDHRETYWSYRAPPWKLARWQLFDLASDPGETLDVANETRRSRRMRRQLESELAAWIESRPVPMPLAVMPDAKTLDDLRALGYAQ